MNTRHLRLRLGLGHYTARVVNALLLGVLRAWLLVVPLVLALSLVRVGQLVHFWPAGYSAQTSDVAAVLWQGFRFDLKVSAIAGFLLLALLPWVSDKAHARIALGLGLVFVLLAFINLHYFGFYKTPVDSLVFGIVEDDTSAVLTTIWRDFPVLWSLLGVALLTALSMRLHRGLLRRVQPRQRWQTRPAAWRVALLLIGFMGLVFAGKGTLREMALQRQHLTVTTSQFLNDMVPNGVIALKYAWDSRKLSQNFADPLTGLRAMGFDSPLAAAQVLGLPHGDEAAVLQALRSHGPASNLSPHSAQTAAGPKKNLLFFLMESWSAEPLRYQSADFDVLGRLAPTLPQACHFDNFDSAQPGTHPSLEAILFSTPITPLTLGELGRKPIPWAIPKVVRDAGYRTLFVTSGRAGWRDLNRVLAAQGFDEVIDATTLKAQYPEAALGIWGVWDEYVFAYLQKRLAAQPADQPLFVFVLTSTNHPPYDLPAHYQRTPLNMQKWQGETSSDTLVPNLHTYRYATDLLGGFVQSVTSGPQGKRTLIAATGDHNVRSFGVFAEAKRRYLMRQVPFIIWGADQPCGNQRHLPASHRDMFSTLLPLAGIEGPYINAGRNLLAPAEPTTSAADKTSAAPNPMNAPRAVFFTGDARNSQGSWQLGNPGSFVCTAEQLPAQCQFNALDDQQERARYGLLDWNVRASLKK